MPRIFNRIVSFQVEGEVYDTETKPEDIIRSYIFSFDKNDNNLYMESRDHRGRITNMVRLPKILKTKKPDTEYFLI